MFQRYSIAFLFVLFFVSPLWGPLAAFARGGEEVGFEHVWELAVEHSPALTRARLAGRSLVAEGLSTAALREPSLEGKGDWPSGSYPADKKAEYEVSIAQPLRLGDLSGARRELGSISRSLGELDERAEVQRFFFTVEESFAELAALERFYRSFEASGGRARTAMARMNGGQAGLSLQGSERALIEAESEGLRGAEHALRAEIAERRGALEKLIGAEIPRGILKVPDLGAPIAPADLIRAVRESPAGLSKRLALQTERSERRLALTRRERNGEILPRVSYRRGDDGTDFLGFGLEVPLPVWGSAGGDILIQDGERETVRAETQFVGSPVFERYLTALSEGYAERRRQVEILHLKVIPALERAAAAGARELAAGQIPVAQFIAIVRELHERCRDAVDAYLTAVRLGAELRVLQGEKL